jgi:hypothetical protein
MSGDLLHDHVIINIAAISEQRLTLASVIYLKETNIQVEVYSLSNSYLVPNARIFGLILVFRPSEKKNLIFEIILK